MIKFIVLMKFLMFGLTMKRFHKWTNWINPGNLTNEFKPWWTKNQFLHSLLCHYKLDFFNPKLKYQFLVHSLSKNLHGKYYIRLCFSWQSILYENSWQVWYACSTVVNYIVEWGSFFLCLYYIPWASVHIKVLKKSFLFCFVLAI